MRLAIVALVFALFAAPIVNAAEITPLPDRNPARPDTRSCLSAEKVLPVIEEAAVKALSLGEQYNRRPYTPTERNQKKMELIASFFKTMVDSGIYRFEVFESDCQGKTTP